MPQQPSSTPHTPLNPAIPAGFFFTSAQDALGWSTEILRRRRLPRLTPLWDELVREVEVVAACWQHPLRQGLPQQAEDRLGLALQVDQALDELARTAPEEAWILRARYWGDWSTPAGLQCALAMQENLRRQGIRARIAYRYTFEQLAARLGCTRKQAYGRFRKALRSLERLLCLRGLMLVPDASRQD